MTYSAHASHDAVLRARVALLGSQTLPARQEVAAARRMYAMEPARDLLLIKALDRYREQLVLMDRKEELDAGEREMALVAAGSGA